MAPKIGFIGIIGEMLASDPAGTLTWVADLGFDGMEGAAALASRFGIRVEEVPGKLQSYGLEAAVQGRIAFEQSEDENRVVIANAKSVGARYVVDYYAPFESRDEILRYADFANRIGRTCADEGLRFLYHNHDQEMRLHSGARGLDILLDHTDPSLVGIELDVAWVTFGGQDPVSMLKRAPERFPVLHMKDFERLHSGSQQAAGIRSEAVFAEVGTGVVNTKGVVDAAIELGTEWLVIEQDRMNRMGPRESLETSYRNLRALLP